MNIPITRPYFSETEIAAVAGVLESGWVSQGPKVAAFEAAFAESVGAAHAVAVSSCTAALHLALIALGIGPGDEVLVPAFTFVATANAVEYCGARPVFVDIDLETYNVDLLQLEAQITSRTRAIVPVHLFGLSVDMDSIARIASTHDLSVIEDAACGVGSRYKGQHVGTFGAAGCFSFHPRKIITTGEGGMLTTNDGTIAEHVRALRSHAATISDLERHERRGFLLPHFSELGFNYRMTDLQAALGLAQIDKLDEIVKRRVELGNLYDAALGGIERLTLPWVPSGDTHPFQAYVVRVSDDAPFSRDELAARLIADGIDVRQGTHAVHALDYYRHRYGLKPEDCPAAWEAERSTLTLPLYPTMTEDDQLAVIEALRGLLCE